MTTDQRWGEEEEETLANPTTSSSASGSAAAEMGVNRALEELLLPVGFGRPGDQGGVRPPWPRKDSSAATRRQSDVPSVPLV